MRPSSQYLRIGFSVASLLLALVGMRWIYLFTFTDYRAHLKPTMIPLGITAVVVGLCLLVWTVDGKAKRFNLRTLLIATTLFAITLGTIIATTR